MKKAALFLSLLLALPFIAGLSASTVSLRLEDSPALWIARSDGLWKVVTNEGKGIVAAVVRGDVRALAVDEGQQTIWGIGRGRLLAFAFDGTPLHKHPLPKGSKQAHLAINPHTGAVWLAARRQLYRLDRDSALQRVHRFSHGIQALTFDASREQLWVAAEHRLVRLDQHGEKIGEIALDPKTRVRDLAYTPALDAMWMATKGSIRRYCMRGTIELDLPFRGIRRIAPDGKGGLWVVTDQRLSRIDRSGLILFSSVPFQDQGHRRILALAADPSDQSLWVANREALRHVAADSQILQHVQLGRNQGSIRQLALYRDRQAPSLAIISPSTATVLNTNRPLLSLGFADAGTGVDPSTLEVRADGLQLEVDCEIADAEARCRPMVPLEDGLILLSATIQDHAGNVSEEAQVELTVDTVAPQIEVTTPANGSLTNEQHQTLVGRLSESAAVTVNGNAVRVGLDHVFLFPVVLEEGVNSLTLTAIDQAGNSSTSHFAIRLDTQAPADPDSDRIRVGDPVDGQATVQGDEGSVEPESLVSVANRRTGQRSMGYSSANGAFRLQIPARFGDLVQIVVRDQAGNQSEPVELATGALPPDPATVAPPLGVTGASSFHAASAFLYSGPNPIQSGITPDTIEPLRAAVLRGWVRESNGQPLAGVTITIQDHPELGRTLSRGDGLFDLAVNGGGQLTVNYRRGGYLPVQRQIKTPWRDYAWLDDVVMIPLDDRVTPIDLRSDVPFQVHQGNPVTDSDGTRQATLFFPKGTVASMTLPDGRTQRLTALHVRATEYTVGATGPDAMPGPLPASSAYTYAVELSADEVLAAQATRVDFSQPVVMYVDNFLEFPTGEVVPVGWYDREQAAWIPSDNGQIVEVLRVNPRGLVELDVDGSGQPATVPALATLGITGAERRELARLYQPGHTLWRVPVTHFTPWDCNWPYGPPRDAKTPPRKKPRTAGENVPDTPDRDLCEGCIIEAQSQVLGEDIPIVGTPFQLHYRSDRSAGYTANHSVTIQLSGDEVAPSLRAIELRIEIAGRVIEERFPALPNQVHTFTWDGLDAYGRKVAGHQLAQIKVGHIYPITYYSSRRPDFAVSFGLVARADEAAGGRALRVLRQSRRSTVIVRKIWNERLGSPIPGAGASIGGWTLSAHHSYYSSGSVLLAGDGVRRSAAGLANVITTAASGGSPHGIAFGPDGSLYIADKNQHRIRRVSPEGNVQTVAGTGTSGFGGDGGPAVAASLAAPEGVAFGPDGSLYIADTENHRIRRVSPDGIIHTVAGSGQRGFSADGGLAAEAYLSSPQGVAVQSDGTFYIADTRNHRIRRVGPNQIITTFAGTGGFGFRVGDGGPAAQAEFVSPTAVALAPDGALYIVDTDDHRIRRVGPDGIITTVVGDGQTGFNGDGGLAEHASVGFPYAMAVAADGTLYIADSRNRRIRRVSQRGIITTVAGSGQFGRARDGGLALQAGFAFASGVAVGPDGLVYIADADNQRVYRVEPVLPGYSVDGIFLPSEDGAQLYEFDSNARHLRTVDPVNGVTLYSFAYDVHGFLVAIEDVNGQATVVSRDGSGRPTAIVAPDGQVTELAVDDAGHLASITNPAGETVRMQYADGGLLTQYADRNGHAGNYDYDDLGRLLRDRDPAGGGWALSRTDQQQGYAVTLTSEEGRSTEFRVESLDVGDQQQVNKYPDGTRYERLTQQDGKRITTARDRTVITRWLGPDPRFGMQAPVVEKTVISTPGGVRATTRYDRTVTLTDPLDPLSLALITETSAINNHSWTTSFNAASRIAIDRTPEGRSQRTVFDERGRPIRVEREGQSTPNYAYDDRGRLVQVSNEASAEERVTTLAYHDMGLQRGYLAAITDAQGHEVSFAYDAAGRITQQTLPDGRAIRFGYDANGNLATLIPPGRSAHVFDYTAVDLEAQYTPPALDQQQTVTRHVYNLDRQLVEIQRPDGSALSFHYAASGKLSSLIIPRGQYLYAYEPTAGHLQQVVAPDGGTVRFTHDGFLPIGQDWDGEIAGNVTDAHDNNFRVIAREVNGGSVSFEYDKDGLLAKAGELVVNRNAESGFIEGTGLGGVVTTRAYNAFGELAEYAALVPGASDQPQIDEINNTLDQMQILIRNEADFDESRLDRLREAAAGLPGTREQTLVRLSSLASAFGERTCGRGGSSEGESESGETPPSTEPPDACAQFQSLARKIRELLDPGNSTMESVYAVFYERDKLGRIIEQRENILGHSQTTQYAYDRGGRLSTVTRDGSVIATYQYDANGNRLTETTPNGSTHGTYDAQDRIVGYGSTTYTHTDNGDLLTKSTPAGTTTYTYDAIGNLISVNRPNGTKIEYLIDGANRRIGKRVNGTLVQGFLYKDQLNPVAELDGNGEVVARFIYADRENVPAYMEKNGKLYRIVSNHLGSPRLVIDTETGDVAQRMDYDAFGNVAKDTNLGFQPFGFAGGIYDRDTRLVRFGARDYDPGTGRWTAKDPIGFTGRDTNLYGYVISDPVNALDPNGKAVNVITAAIGAIGGAISGATSSLVTQAARPGPIKWAGVAEAAFTGAAVGALTGLTLGAALATGTIGSVAGVSYAVLIEDQPNAIHFPWEEDRGVRPSKVERIGMSCTDASQ